MKLLTLATLTMLVGPAAVAAQSQVELPVRGDTAVHRHPEAAEAISQLKSPYCPGFMLEVCSSTQGAALRDSIQMLAEQGWSSERLIEWMLANHGEEYRALPKKSGSTLIVAWIIPPLGLLLGLGIVVVAIRKLRSSAEPTPSVAGEISAEDEERLREAIRELDAEEEATFF